jgi:hypothetical protein
MRVENARSIKRKDMIGTIGEGHLYMKVENARAIEPKDMIATLDYGHLALALSSFM